VVGLLDCLGFWANQYLPFLHNESPKGVLARLFTINPAAHPLTVAPGAVTVLWLVLAVVVLVLTVAVTSIRPLRRDALSLLEVGLAIEAIMLVSPLTERPYFLFLLIPLIGLFCWVREVGVAGLFERRATVVAVLFWLLLAGRPRWLNTSSTPGSPSSRTRLPSSRCSPRCTCG